jgi:hypothetical protein
VADDSTVLEYLLRPSGVDSLAAAEDDESRPKMDDERSLRDSRAIKGDWDLFRIWEPGVAGCGED